jgi:hypothetical protein
VELDRDLARAGRLQEAGRPVAVEGDLAVGGVVANEEVVAAGEVDGALEEVEAGGGAERVVRVVEPEDAGAVGDRRRHRFQVGQVVVGLEERQVVGLGAGEEGADVVEGVGRVGHEGRVARADQAEGDVDDALLRAEEGQHLGRGVEPHAEAALEPVGEGGAQLGQPVRAGIAVVGGVERGLAQRLDDVGRRRQVRVAAGEVDDVDALGAHARDRPREGGQAIGRDPFHAGVDAHGVPPGGFTALRKGSCVSFRAERAIRDPAIGRRRVADCSLRSE